MRLPSLRVALLIAVLGGCSKNDPNSFVEARQACADRNPLRNVYFGDLHVHTRNSFDAYAFEVRVSPEGAYQFAKGEEVVLPPIGGDGQGTRRLRLRRPLDFAAVTDHSEFLGEVNMCTEPGHSAYESDSCKTYRHGSNGAVIQLGILVTQTVTGRPSGICGPDPRVCLGPAGVVWDRIKAAAEQAYDRTSACSFTSFVAYEYSGAPEFSTLHRNVIFRNEKAPFPVSYFEQLTPKGLWEQLKAQCIDANIGCDVLAIPHNSNESNGRMFLPEYPGAANVEEEKAQATLRAAIEPLVEIYQHKSDSECMNGISGIMGQPDEMCVFEKHIRDPFEDCGDGVGSGGITRGGCFSRRDFVRGALLVGLREHQRLGVDPFQLGIIASTDTHNGTPGAVAEDLFIGHRGTDDDTPEKRLGRGMLTPGGIEFSAGGLAAVWAVENSRNAIFEALRRRETFGTSGPRISVRFFGGWGYPTSLCGDPMMVDKGYAGGVPMGGTLSPPPTGATAPTFVLSALRDPGTAQAPGNRLQVVQIIKGWIQNGETHQQVFDVAGDRNNGASVDLATCQPQGTGSDSLCGVFTDPSFDPSQPAFYYARVIENPSCRWSTYQCNALPAGSRPDTCTDSAIPKAVRERAWTSPIWYRPAAP